MIVNCMSPKNVFLNCPSRRLYLFHTRNPEQFPASGAVIYSRLGERPVNGPLHFICHLEIGTAGASENARSRRRVPRMSNFPDKSFPTFKCRWAYTPRLPIGPERCAFGRQWKVCGVNDESFTFDTTSRQSVRILQETGTELIELVTKVWRREPIQELSP